MKKISKIVNAILIVALCGIILSCVTTLFPKRTEYKLPLNISSAIFGSNPEEFFDTYYDYYDLIEDFRKHADIDKEGNLILRLTKKQENGLLKSCSGAIAKAKKEGFYISDDNSYFVISGYAETIGDKIFNFPVLTAHEMAIRQLLSGKNPKTISVTAYLKDEGTGKTVYTATWPKENIKLSFNEEDYTSKP